MAGKKKKIGKNAKFGNPIKRWIVYFIMVIFPVSLFLALLAPVSIFTPFKFEVLVPDGMIFMPYVFAVVVLVIVISRYAFEYAWEWGIESACGRRK